MVVHLAWDKILTVKAAVYIETRLVSGTPFADTSWRIDALANARSPKASLHGRLV